MRIGPFAVVVAAVSAALHLVSGACGSDRPIGGDAGAPAPVEASADAGIADSADGSDGDGDEPSDARVPIDPAPIVPLRLR
ncbi:MAG TPA: hypothetical protein VIF09_28920 [Polyangiaceae bacterium]|jgi:hypothetical protein